MSYYMYVTLVTSLSSTESPVCSWGYHAETGINYRIRALICPMTIKMRCDGHGAQWDAARRHALRSGVGP